MSKTVVNVQPIIDMIREKLSPLGTIRVFKGTGKNDGHFMIKIMLDIKTDLSVDVDMNEVLTNKHYFDDFVKNVYELRDESDRRRFEACRMGY